LQTKTHVFSAYECCRFLTLRAVSSLNLLPSCEYLVNRLERRFLERVAQTNRVKSSGVGGGQSSAAPQQSSSSSAAAAAAGAAKARSEELDASMIGGSDGYQHGGVGRGGNNHNAGATAGEPPSPPWLQPPLGYKHGTGAAFAAANMSGANSRAAAAGRALLGGGMSSGGNGNSSTSSLMKEVLDRKASAGLLAMAEMQQQQKLLQNAFNSGSASNLLAAMARSGSSSGLSSNNISQLAQSASGMYWLGTISLHSVLVLLQHRRERSPIACSRFRSFFFILSVVVSCSPCRTR